MGKNEYFDELETRSPESRERELFDRLPDLIEHAQKKSSGWKKHLHDVNATEIDSRSSLTNLPVLRKSELMELQSATPPFGGFTADNSSQFGRIYMSPGPVWEPQGIESDSWNSARALYAAGFRRGDVIHNAFSYQMTPGGFILDEGARFLGCAVFPAGTGNTELQLQAIEKLSPIGFTGTPDYLKILLDEGDAAGTNVSSIKKALFSGGALFPSLRQEYENRGVAALQCYATADLGVIAYESEAKEGMIVNENYIVEVVRPGTETPVDEGEVGELVVTSFNKVYPLIRFGTGDLTAIMEGSSPCGRTNVRIKGWMGRADQRTKVKGMFVDPRQIAEVTNRHVEILKARLTVSREGEQDVMQLEVETSQSGDELREEVAETLREITKIKGKVKIVAQNSLPNDGKIIADERDYEQST